MHTSGLLLSLFFVGVVGFGAGKLQLFDEAARRAIVKFVFYIATSALLIQAVVSIDTHSFGRFPRFVFANTVAIIAIYLAMYGVLRLLRTKYRIGASILYASNVSNNIYIGLPFIWALYGNEGLRYAAVYLALPMTLGDLAQFYILSRWRHSSLSARRFVLDFIQNPIVISIVIGAIIVLLGIKLPSPIGEGIDFLGRSATGLAIFAMGLFLSLSSWKHFHVKLALLTTVLKLFVVPFAALLICKYAFHLSHVALAASVIMLAMPSAIFCMVVATEYDFDEHATADAIILSSVAFLATSLLWVHILK
jgi:predicted permease